MNLRTELKEMKDKNKKEVEAVTDQMKFFKKRQEKLEKEKKLGNNSI